MAKDASEKDASEKFYMLNALWFKEDGGAEKYRAYIQAAGPIVAKHGGKGQDAYHPSEAIIGQFDADIVFFVGWPSWEVFEKFLADPEYVKIQHLREEAITKSLLIRCEPVKWTD